MKAVIKKKIEKEKKNPREIFLPYSCEYEAEQEKEDCIVQEYIQARQAEYIQLFGQLSDIINIFGEKYKVVNIKEEPLKNNEFHDGDDPQASTSSDNIKNIMSVDEEEEEVIYPRAALDSPNMIIIGPNGTQITVEQYDSISWQTEINATRTLLSFIFDSYILATHTLTGKPSPAFLGRERPSKGRLDPDMVADIVHIVCLKCNCPARNVRAAITTKCSDSAKKFKRCTQYKMR